MIRSQYFVFIKERFEVDIAIEEIYDDKGKCMKCRSRCHGIVIITWEIWVFFIRVFPILVNQEKEQFILWFIITCHSIIFRGIFFRLSAVMFAFENMLVIEQCHFWVTFSSKNCLQLYVVEIMFDIVTFSYCCLHNFLGF